jgi:predicted dehydrogenase
MKTGMTSKRSRVLAASVLAGVALTGRTGLAPAQSGQPSAPAEIRLVTVNPGHYHAALFQKEMLPGVAETAHVYAPLGPDLTEHLNRLARFNLRADHPTHWKLEIHAGPDYFARMLAERPGNVVILSGENRHKIDQLLASVRAGLNVLADKPWIIEPEQFATLRRALDTADAKGVVAFDAMTQRFDVTCLIQRELINDPDIFGACLKGSPEQPAVRIESTHHLLKEVAGVPNVRPPWFFDVRQQGEGLTDVGTHLVERAQWMLFPGQPIDYQRDVVVLHGAHWPTVLTREQFQRVTGWREFPDYLAGVVKSDRLEYFCNNTVRYTLRGIHVAVKVTWNFEPAPGENDSTLAVFRGSNASIEARQGKAEQFRPEIYVVPHPTADPARLRRAVEEKIAALRRTYPGLELETQTGRFHVVIPAVHRQGHEAEFAELCRHFLSYVREPKSLPAWEKPNLLAKYFVTTRGVELARTADSTKPAN